MPKENLAARVNEKEFREFLVEAKRAGYADENARKILMPDGSIEIIFKRGPLHYIDIYHADQSKHIGTERVWLREKHIWQMNYAGKLLLKTERSEPDSEMIYSFLKEVLKNVKASSPFRGPITFTKDPWFYFNDIEGTIDSFHGKEIIKHKNLWVYEGFYNGEGF